MRPASRLQARLNKQQKPKAALLRATGQRAAPKSGAAFDHITAMKR